MKYTLLQLTQSILASLGSDEVNSIGDTTESQQVAEFIRQSYYNMTGRYDLPEHNQFVNLNASGDPTKPTLMTKPDGVQRIEWLTYYDSNPNDGAGTQVSQFGSYSHDLNTDIVPTNFTATSTSSVTIATGNATFVLNANTYTISVGEILQAVSGLNILTGSVVSWTPGTSTVVINVSKTVGSGTLTSWIITPSAGMQSPPGYLGIDIVDIHDFLYEVGQFNINDPNVGTYILNIPEITTGSPQTFSINYKNNIQPHMCAILSNQYILFDSYDGSQDTTLQASKTLAFAWLIPSFTIADTFIPNLDEQQFPLLLNEAKSLAFLELKHHNHQKAEHEVLRQLASLQKFKALANRPSPFEQLPNFGRRKGTGGYAIYRR